MTIILGLLAGCGDTDVEDSMPPVAVLSASPAIVTAGVDIVHFDAGDSYDPDGGQVGSYYFDFGDGASSEWVTVSSMDHLYGARGIYDGRVKVRNDAGTVSDWSSPVVITVTAPACTPTITSPDGGEVWRVGDTYSITWTVSGSCGSNVRIELFLDQVECETIAASTTNDGSHDWMPRQCGPYTHGYEIRVTDLDTGNYDESNATFVIARPRAR